MVHSCSQRTLQAQAQAMGRGNRGSGEAGRIINHRAGKSTWMRKQDSQDLTGELMIFRRTRTVECEDHVKAPAVSGSTPRHSPLFPCRLLAFLHFVYFY